VSTWIQERSGSVVPRGSGAWVVGSGVDRERLGRAGCRLGSGSGARGNVELRKMAGSVGDKSGVRFGRLGACGGVRFWDAPARTV
jgi:hypothetical protein